jgi:hypothetical protein
MSGLSRTPQTASKMSVTSTNRLTVSATDLYFSIITDGLDQKIFFSLLIQMVNYFLEHSTVLKKT